MLRELAKLVAEAAARPEQAEKARLWHRLNALSPERPMIFADPQGGWGELVPDSSLACQGARARGVEMALRHKLYRAEHIPDDYPLRATLDIAWQIEVGDYGMHDTQRRTAESGSYAWDPPLKQESDFARLRPRELSVDRPGSMRALERAAEAVGDILEVRLVGVRSCRAKLTRDLIHLRGLEQMMLDMYDRPAFLHGLMAFLRDEMQREWEYYEREGLLSLNSGPDDTTGSGGVSHTDALPAGDYRGQARRCDMWCWGESQETVGVGPTQFTEFVLDYQLPLLEPFGLVDYGCCEPLDRKLDAIMARIPRLRSVAVSPWADRQLAAEKLGNRYVYVYKPNPSPLCSPVADLEAAERDVLETLRIARGCCLSIVMKDTHTFGQEPRRLTAWCQLARRAVEGATPRSGSRAPLRPGSHVRRSASSQTLAE